MTDRQGLQHAKRRRFSEKNAAVDAVYGIIEAILKISYTGNHSLRTELRRLHSMGLLKKHPGRNIGDIKDNLVVELSNYVCLTESGKEWVKIISNSEEILQREQREDRDQGRQVNVAE